MRSPTLARRKLKQAEELTKKKKQLEDSGKKLTNSEIQKTQMKRLQSTKKSMRKLIEVTGNSLGIFSPDNCLRKVCHKIVAWRLNDTINYDNVVLLLIGISTILLTLDNPLQDKNSTYSFVLKIIDYVMTVIFTLECLINIILFGLMMNGESSYLKSNWNKMDMLIVILAWVSVVMEGSGLSLNYLKVFRMLRVLRPLRVLKRNQGMQIQVVSLINASSDYGNLMLITFLVLILFGIQGITFFKGKFFVCDSENVPEDIHASIKTMWDCYDVGGEWVSYNQNFDNIHTAVITMFNLMTTEGWMDVLWHAVDSTDIHQMPVRNANPYNVIFFMAFLIVGAMILLNAFGGVVVMSFTKEKISLTQEDKITTMERDYCDVMRRCFTSVPVSLFTKSNSLFRNICYRIAETEAFDHFIFTCIVLNTICLALSWYDRPEKVGHVLDVLNYIFTGIYTLEFFIKLVAYKLEYFYSGWNFFDFTIVVSAAVGILLDVVFQIDIGFATTIIRSFRIARILKIVRRLQTLQKIVNTFVVAIPELVNVGGLLILFIYLYSVLGVFLFADVKYSQILNNHANFRDFPTAAMTLFRIVTGEGWHEIMFDCARQRSIFFECVND